MRRAWVCSALINEVSRVPVRLPAVGDQLTAEQGEDGDVLECLGTSMLVAVQEGEQVVAGDVEPKRCPRETRAEVSSACSTSAVVRLALSHSRNPLRPAAASPARPASHPVDTGAP
jgi:hypothetical protein